MNWIRVGLKSVSRASSSLGSRAGHSRAIFLTWCTALLCGCATNIPPPQPGVTAPAGLRGAVALAAAESEIWVGLVTQIGFDEAPNRYHLAELDPESNLTVATVDIGSGYEVTDIEVAFGYVWVAMSPGRILKVDPQRREVVDRIEVGPGGLQRTFNHYRPDLAVGDDGVWVLTAENLQKIRLANSTPESFPVDHAFGKPISISAGAGALWVVHKNGVSRLDSRTGAMVASIPLELHRYGREIVATTTAVWVADGVGEGVHCLMTPEKSAGTVYRIDPATNRVGASARLPCGAHLVQGANADPVIVYEVHFKRKDKRGNYYEEWIAALEQSTAEVRHRTRVYAGKIGEHWRRFATEQDSVWVCDERGLREISLVQ